LRLTDRSLQNDEVTVTIPSGLSDDNDFIEKLNSMLGKLIAVNSTERLWVIQIDNWFDHKWLGFSGKGIVDFKFPEYMHRFDAALDEFYQDHVTFPPFTPNRVLNQWSFQRSGQHLIEVPLVKLPHATERRPSNSNLQRRIAKSDPASLCVWFSGNTLKNGRGSVMVYDLRSSEPTRWFVAFVRKAAWVPALTKGVSQQHVTALLGTE
jgi:hypothetical protein